MKKEGEKTNGGMKIEIEGEEEEEDKTELVEIVSSSSSEEEKEDPFALESDSELALRYSGPSKARIRLERLPLSLIHI